MKDVNSKSAHSIFMVATAAAFILLSMPAHDLNADMLDNKRNGITFNVGFGMAPYSSWSGTVTTTRRVRIQYDYFCWGCETIYRSVTETVDRNDNMPGPSVSGFIGYIWNNHDAIGLQFDISGLTDEGGIEQGLYGLAWYHYFKSESGAPFITLAVGRFRSVNEEFSSFPTQGIGMSVGAGYQFTQNYQGLITFTTGETNREFDTKKHRVVSLKVQRVWF